MSGETPAITLKIKSGPSGGAIIGTATVTAAKGVATFSNILFDVAGAYTLKATATGLTTVISGAITINSAAASQLVFARQPANVAAGAASAPAITVDVEDSFGNLVTTSSAKVTLAIKSGPAGSELSGTLNVAAQTGVATFSNVLLDTAGKYKLTATHGTLTAAKSSKFTVSAAAASKLAFSVQPSSVTTNTAISPPIVVDVEDQFGNLVSTDNSDVILSIKKGTASSILGGTLTIAADGGAATFDDVSLNLAGTYKLKAADGSLTAAKSSPFAVSS
jgi:hypothetical protein